MIKASVKRHNFLAPPLSKTVGCNNFELVIERTTRRLRLPANNEGTEREREIVRIRE